MEPEPLSIRTSDYLTGTILELKSPIPGHRHGLKRPRPPPFRHPSSLQCSFEKNPVSSFYEATENELQVSEMAISKKSNRVLKVTYFEIIACLPTSTLKVLMLMLEL